MVGLPEKAEGTQPALFAYKFFKDLLQLTDISPIYVVERAHRVPLGNYPPGAPPRPFLLRFLKFRNRDRILAEAHEKEELH